MMTGTVSWDLKEIHRSFSLTTERVNNVKHVPESEYFVQCVINILNHSIYEPILSFGITYSHVLEEKGGSYRLWVFNTGSTALKRGITLLFDHFQKCF